MWRFLDVAETGLAAVLLHSGRSTVTALALVVILLPYLVGLGISQGVEREAAASVRAGADLYVSGTQFGREVPLPAAAADAVRRVDGVADVTPRIVGHLVLGKEDEPAVLVGLPPGHTLPSAECMEGRFPENAPVNELAVGRELAARLGLRVGSVLPPFYHSARGERLSRVVGIFRADVSLWGARLVLTTLEAAADIFDEPGLATDLLVDCRPGYETAVRAAILRELDLPAGAGGGRVRPHVVSREDMEALLPRGLLHREGVFNLLFLPAFAVGIGVILVTSGFGQAERRREVGILKATGWQTDEVLLRATAESLTLAVAGAAAAFLLAFAWLRWLNGYGVAGVFLVGVGAAPHFQVPYRLAPVPAVLAGVLAFVLVMTGSLYSTWRAAVTPPREAMR